MTDGNRPNDPLFVDAVLTPLSEAEASYYLKTAWQKLFNEIPSIDTLSLLWAHTALEVDRWKQCYNWCWGNVKKIKSNKYTSYKCSEVVNGINKDYIPYNSQTFFSAYDSVEEGAEAYLMFLKGERYAGAFTQLIAGNPVKYCAALKVAGYFTADLIPYTAGVVSLVKEFKKRQEELTSWEPEVKVIAPVINQPIEPIEIQQSIQPIVKLGWINQLWELILGLFKK